MERFFFFIKKKGKSKKRRKKRERRKKTATDIKMGINFQSPAKFYFLEGWGGGAFCDRRQRPILLANEKSAFIQWRSSRGLNVMTIKPSDASGQQPGIKGTLRLAGLTFSLFPSSSLQPFTAALWAPCAQHEGGAAAWIRDWGL